MLSEPDNQQHTAEWYLIASRGDLMLRLAQDLRIGEDGAGGIVLSPSRENALLGLSLSGGELTLRALALNWTFCETGGFPKQHMTFSAGTTIRLNFPYSWVVITPHFLAGPRARPDRVIDLKPITPPAVALSRLTEPVILVERERADSEPYIPIGVATTEEIAALLEATHDEVSERLLRTGHDVPDESVSESQPASPEPPPARTGPRSTEVPIAAVQTTPADTPPARRLRTRRRRLRHGPLAAVIAVAAVLAPMALILNEPEMLGVAPLDSGEVLSQPPDTGSETPAGLTTVAEAAAGTRSGSESAADEVRPADTAETDEAGPVPAAKEPVIAAAEAAGNTAPFEQPLPQAETTSELTSGDATLADLVPVEDTATTGDPVVTTSTAEDSPTGSVAPDPAAASVATMSEADAARVNTLLAEAQSLLDSGDIVTPVHDNAVDRLIEVLTLDPTNEEGLRLMYLSAVTLVEQAEVAHAAGNDYVARNLLEDVLGFHPEFEMARKLQQDWLEEEERSVNGNG